MEPELFEWILRFRGSRHIMKVWNVCHAWEFALEVCSPSPSLACFGFSVLCAVWIELHPLADRPSFYSRGGPLRPQHSPPPGHLPPPASPLLHALSGDSPWLDSGLSPLPDHISLQPSFLLPSKQWCPREHKTVNWKECIFCSSSFDLTNVLESGNDVIFR